MGRLRRRRESLGLTVIEVKTDIAGALLRVTGETAHEVLAQLVSVEKSEIALTIGRLNTATDVPERMGRLLGAELLEEAEATAPAPAGFGSAQVPPWAKVVPGAPVVNGVPAWLVNGKHPDGRPWVAFVHPDTDIDRSLPETSDTEDPRLGAGTAWFRRFVK